MKKKIIMICAAVLALVLALFALTACNHSEIEANVELVSNGDFSSFDDESSTFVGWTTSSSSVTYGSTTLVDSNNTVLYIDNSSKAYSYLYQTVAIEPGKIYKVSVDMRVDSRLNSNSGAYVGFLENTGYKFVARTDATNNEFVSAKCYIRPTNTDYLTLALCLGSEDDGCSGRVYFDNISIMRVESEAVEEGYDVIDFKKVKSVTTSSTASGIVFVVMLTLLTVFVIVGLYFVIRRLYAKRDVFVNLDGPSAATYVSKKQSAVKNSKWYCHPAFIVCMLMLGTFLVRLGLLLGTYGFGTTTATMVTNAKNLLGVEGGVTGFFEKYPKSTVSPGEIYILAALGAICAGDVPLLTISILARFINVLADMAVVAMIYFYGRKYVGDKLSTVYATMYAALPYIFVMSGINTSFASVLVALLVATVILMVEKKYLPTYLMLTLSAVLDMRAMAIAPIVVAYFAYRYYKDDSTMRTFTANRAMIVFGLIASFVLGYVITLPIGIHQIADGDAFFNFKMLVQQIQGRTYFVNNAFNLYGMVAMNGKSISQKGVSILNLIFLLVLEAYVISLYFKNRNKQELILIVAFTLATISVFTLKVDYTYLFLSIAFALIYTMISGERRMYGIMAGYSALGILDVAQLLNQSKLIGAEAPETLPIISYETTSPFYIFFCVLTVLLTCYYVYVVYSITNNSKLVDIKGMSESIPAWFKRKLNDIKVSRSAKDAE